MLVALTGHGLAFWLVANVAPEAPASAPPPLMVTLLALSKEPSAPQISQARPQPIHAPPAAVATPSTPPLDAPAAELTAAPVIPIAAAASAPPESSPAAPVVLPRFDAAYLNNPRPTYPVFSKRLNEQGTVQLRVHVLASGLPDQVEIGRSSGFPRLDNAARDAVLQWRFVPARRGSEAVAEWVIVPLAFVLER
ncbi:MAG: energy transducer TonB [Rhodocyclaceae bacterium]|jgi:protein TonB|nr:energy transducer TonB [Rhodocyclaceae bacterium]